jgi:hypothetical protein
VGNPLNEKDSLMVSPKNRTILWARAAGRCQYEGCNQPLIGDFISGNDTLNAAYVAHIVGENANGPRGDVIRSPLLADNVENLMLMCDRHHRLIDIEDIDGHPEAALLSMKVRHEARIDAIADIKVDRSSHVLLYGARIGEHDFPVRFDLAKLAMLPKRYPAERQPIALDMSGIEFDDGEPAYWALQVENLRRQFERKLRDRLRSGEVQHLSLFALAPQPLLVELGRLLSDIAGVDVYQLHREPQGWDWREGRPPITFKTSRAETQGKVVALKLAVSATITDERVAAVLGTEAPIWSVTIDAPHNDIMHRTEDLASFRRAVRVVLDRIKAVHGEDAVIHVFPALPVSAAVEVGRVWMPKADLPLVIYDQRHGQGFVARTRLENIQTAAARKEVIHV